MVNDVSAESLFARHGTRFECIECGACCAYQVELNPSDIERLGRADPEVEERLERSDPRCPLTIKHRGGSEDYLTRCVYLDDAYKCSVYDARPAICMLYPFFPIPDSDITNLGVEVPDDAVSIKEARTGSIFHVALDPSCPGLGCGGKVDWQKFRETFEGFL